MTHHRKRDNMNAKITFFLGATVATACLVGVAAVVGEPNAEETPAPTVIREMDSLKVLGTPKPKAEPTVEPEVTEDALPEDESPVEESPEVEQPPSHADEEPADDSVPPIPAEVTPMSYEEYVQAFIDDGFSVGDVIVCENGWTVGIDEYEGGISWAACM